MLKILIATHSRFASGIKDTAEFIVGKQKYLHSINCYVDGVDLKKEIEGFFDNVIDGDIVVLMTDLMVGSVNQQLIKYMNRPKTYLITGFNLPLLLEIVMSDESMIDESAIEEMINASKEQIILVNKFSELNMCIGEDEDD
ncbi:PTS system mannose-specific EIIAB component [Clostridium tertium]|uniref:PTS system mannose-specific EIIAB component n=1 Tax=Clostridium tertium TaxID=1559 RepID=A0A6N3G3N9_9CLOT